MIVQLQMNLPPFWWLFKDKLSL